MDTVNIQPEKECRRILSPVTLADTMQLLSGNWTLQIVAFLLRNGKTRFLGLQKGFTGISARVLSYHLQELEHHNLVTRTVIDAKLTSVD